MLRPRTPLRTAGGPLPSRYLEFLLPFSDHNSIPTIPSDLSPTGVAGLWKEVRVLGPMSWPRLQMASDPYRKYTPPSGPDQAVD
ncbi:hypothetical protein FS837_002383, partial [Tulasnella sp. UAMH 9824]